VIAGCARRNELSPRQQAHRHAVGSADLRIRRRTLTRVISIGAGAFGSVLASSFAVPQIAAS
jgi:hypothetical protein